MSRNSCWFAKICVWNDELSLGREPPCCVRQRGRLERAKQPRCYTFNDRHVSEPCSSTALAFFSFRLGFSLSSSILSPLVPQFFPLALMHAGPADKLNSRLLLVLFPVSTPLFPPWGLTSPSSSLITLISIAYNPAGRPLRKGTIMGEISRNKWQYLPFAQVNQIASNRIQQGTRTKNIVTWWPSLMAYSSILWYIVNSANTNSRQMMQNPIMISNIPQWNDQEKFFFKKEKIKDSIAYWSRKTIGFRYK